MDFVNWWSSRWTLLEFARCRGGWTTCRHSRRAEIDVCDPRAGAVLVYSTGILALTHFPVR